jgi:hypothetical protein
MAIRGLVLEKARLKKPSSSLQALTFGGWPKKGQICSFWAGSRKYLIDYPYFFKWNCA